MFTTDTNQLLPFIVLTIKPTRCTNSWILFLELNSTYFGQFFCPSSWVFHCTHSNGLCHTGLLTVCEQDQDGNGTAVQSWSCSQAVSKPVLHTPLLCVQWKTRDDGQRNCAKHVEFYSKNEIQKLVHLVGFIIRTIKGSNWFVSDVNIKITEKCECRYVV